MKHLCLLPFFLLTLSLSAQDTFTVDVRGQGPDVVLLPGLVSSGEVWWETVAALPHHRTHTMTLAGFAGQPPLDNDTTFFDQIQPGIVAYLRTLPEPALLIGHSLGGFLSLKIALEHPELVERVLIVDSYPFYSAAMQPDITPEQAALQAKGMYDFTLAQNDAMRRANARMVAGFMVKDTTYRRRIIEWSLDSDVRTGARAMYELMTTDLRAALGKLRVPVRVLASWESMTLMNVSKEEVQAGFEKQYTGGGEWVDLAMAPGGYHFLMYDEPEWFLGEVRRFVGYGH